MAGALPAARPTTREVGPCEASRIGPNAVTQLAAALRAHHGDAVAREVFASAGLQSSLGRPPDGMVDERMVAALYRGLFRNRPPEAAMAAAAEAGRRTADYLLANRIPSLARAVLRRLPAVLASRMLLRAIAANAWTFAGSGRVVIRPGRPAVLEIEGNPLAMPGCIWHVAVFERLFRALATPTARVRHTRCCRDGAPACRFEIAVGAGPDRGDRPVAAAGGTDSTA